MREKNLVQERVKWIDTAKGIGILLVVIGHSFRDGMRTKREENSQID